MILASSRYTTATVQTVIGPDGSPRQEMAVAFPTSVQIQYSWYQVLSGDRIDTLAARFLGASELWWVIANANPEILLWNSIPIGSVIRIPNGQYS